MNFKPSLAQQPYRARSENGQPSSPRRRSPKTLPKISAVPTHRRRAASHAPLPPSPPQPQPAPPWAARRRPGPASPPRRPHAPRLPTARPQPRRRRQPHGRGGGGQPFPRAAASRPGAAASEPRLPRRGGAPAAATATPAGAVLPGRVPAESQPVRALHRRAAASRFHWWRGVSAWRCWDLRAAAAKAHDEPCGERFQQQRR